MSWLIEQIFSLIGLGVLLLLAAAVLAPLESLRWCRLGRQSPRLEDYAEPGRRSDSGSEPLPEADVYILYLSGNPLTGQRALAPFWRKMREIQTKTPASLVPHITINIRNMLQVAVSADPRCGPIYSLGVAEEIARSLARHGY